MCNGNRFKSINTEQHESESRCVCELLNWLLLNRVFIILCVRITPVSRQMSAFVDIM